MMKRINFWASVILACMVLAAMGPQAFADVQLLSNPGFEETPAYNGWFTFGAGVQWSTPSTDNIARTDTASAKVFGEFTNCPIPSFDVGGFGQDFTPVVGQDYLFTGYSLVSGADTIPGGDTCFGNRLIAKIVFFNAPTGGLEISSNEIILGDWTTPRDVWIPFVVSAPAPPGAKRVEALILFLQPGCDEGSVFVDDLFFCERTPVPDSNVLVNPGFDTDLSGWTAFGNVYHDARSWAVRTPSGSAKLFGTFSPGNDSGMFQQFNTQADKQWKFSGYALNSCQDNDGIRGSNENQALARIEFLDAGGVAIGGADEIIADNTSPLGTWTRFHVLATAPAGTDSVRAYILFTQGVLLEGGAIFVDDLALDENVASGIGDVPTADGATLHQNAPNPFNPTTQISFELLRRDDVEVSVYDVTGRLVNTLFRGKAGPGPHRVTWDGTATNGMRVSSGVYLYVLRTSNQEIARRMVLLK